MQYLGAYQRFTRALAMPLLLGACAAAFGSTTGAAPGPDDGNGYCWRDTTSYRPPDFEGYFPDSPEGAEALARWWNDADRDASPSGEAVETVRRGLRRYQGDPMPLLRWLGNACIWNQKPQDAGAIELMYHAAGAESDAIRAPAVYFGLSTMRPMTPAILRTLVVIAMDTGDPNTLSRIAWGVDGQVKDALPYLRPYHESSEPAVREKAEIVKRILRRELQAFRWAREQQRARLEEQYRDELPRIAEKLAQGDSERRLDTLKTIEREGITLIMEAPFIQHLAACADDPEQDVRGAIARIVGERWIWTARNPHPDAINLMLKLSHDADREVRYNAVYYGLSTIPNKRPPVIRRLIEIAMADREPNLYNRIAWALRAQRPQARAELDRIVAEGDPQQAQQARAVYADLGGVAYPNGSTGTAAR